MFWDLMLMNCFYIPTKIFKKYIVTVEIFIIFMVLLFLLFYDFTLILDFYMINTQFREAENKRKSKSHHFPSHEDFSCRVKESNIKISLMHDLIGT